MKSLKQLADELGEKRVEHSHRRATGFFVKAIFEEAQKFLTSQFKGLADRLTGHNYKVTVDNQIKLPDVQKVSDSQAAETLKSVAKGIVAVEKAVTALESEYKKATATLSKDLKPEKVDFATVIKAIQSIKFPEIEIPDHPTTMEVSNLTKIEKLLSAIAVEAKKPYPVTEIPEFPKSITVGNLKQLEAILVEVRDKLVETKKERPIGFSWTKSRSGKLESFTEVYPNGTVTSEGWDIGMVTIRDDRNPR